MQKRYREEELIGNRVSVLVWGGGESDRRAWAQEAAGYYMHEGGMFEAKDTPAVERALNASKGVVYVPDATQISWDVQRELARTLKEKEERAKFIVGLPANPQAMKEKGLLRDDLEFLLSRGFVDLSSAEIKEAIKKRRVKKNK